MLKQMVEEVRNNEDLYSEEGFSKEEFYAQIDSFLEELSLNPAGSLSVDMVGCYESLEDCLEFIVSEYGPDLTNSDEIYEVITNNDLYLYKVNDMDKIVVIQK